MFRVVCEEFEELLELRTCNFLVAASDTDVDLIFTIMIVIMIMIMIMIIIIIVIIIIIIVIAIIITIIISATNNTHHLLQLVIEPPIAILKLAHPAKHS